MKKVLLNLFLVSLPVLGNSQIFQENFDGTGPGITAWTVLDVDGLTPDSQVSFITNGWNRIEETIGNYAAMSTSYYNPAGTSNDWLISPQITISGSSPTLYWDAKAQDGDFPDGYKVMLAPNGGNTVADFTVELYSTTAENDYWISRYIDLTPYVGQNVRFAFVNNSNDKFLLTVDNIKVDYTFVQPPPSYCGPLNFDFFGFEGDEPITLVNFAGIDNTTDPTAYTGNDHEYFLSQTASVSQGQSYNITLKGNTSGNFTNNFAVFVDWNQNGSFSDPGEVYNVTQTITNSTGTDAIQAVHSIAVPSGATLGTTRIRVKKSDDPASVTDPCVGGEFGQAEDYTINVTAALSVNETDKSNTVFKIYPNPVNDILNIDSQIKVKSIEIFDLSGKKVLTSENNSSKFNINLSGLTSGAYIIKAQTEKGSQSAKIIKK